MGFGTGELAFATAGYEPKRSAGSSHQVLLRWAEGHPPGRVLDLGCSDGYLAGELRDRGHHVTGIDVRFDDAVEKRVDRFIEADLDRGLPEDLDGPFDIVLAADVLEHVRSPAAVLEQLRGVVSPASTILVSIPNFSHWYPRSRVALGRFDYDGRGILDHDHVRFFTKRSFERLLAGTGYRIVRFDGTGLPIDVVERGGRGAPVGQSRVARVIGRADRASVAMRPQLFAYQLLYELNPIP
jgi:SAM-dependent methyltransferase